MKPDPQRVSRLDPWFPAEPAPKDTPKVSTQPRHASPEDAPEEDEATGLNLSQAIRAGFEALPESKEAGSRDALRALKEWIKTNHTHLADKIETATFGSTLAGQRKKVAGGETVAKSSPHAAHVVNTEPTFPEVLKVRELCAEQKTTPEKMIAILEVVEAFGNLDKMKKALSYASQIK